MPVSIELHVEWISDCIQHMRDNALETIEASQEAEDRWVEHVSDVAKETLLGQADSWYLGANIPGKTRVVMPYPGGHFEYRKRCEKIARNGYSGFDLSR